MNDMLNKARAEALFASNTQISDHPTPTEVRTAIRITVRRIGVNGCACCVAGEFGDHPDNAVLRMAWAIRIVHAMYPTDISCRRRTVRVGFTTELFTSR